MRFVRKFQNGEIADVMDIEEYSLPEMKPSYNETLNEFGLTGSPYLIFVTDDYYKGIYLYCRCVNPGIGNMAPHYIDRGGSLFWFHMYEISPENLLKLPRDINSTYLIEVDKLDIRSRTGVSGFNLAGCDILSVREIK